MNTTDRKKLLRSNTLLWLFAMTLPAVFSLAFADTRFPWPVIVPLLLFGCLLASNRMLAQALGPASDAAEAPPPQG